jgi:hypothetical protein
MNINKEQIETSSGLSTETKSNSKESEACNYKYNSKSSIKHKKKKVTFKKKLVNVIKVESYKQYNGDNEPIPKQNFRIPKYKEINCTCLVW